MTRPAESPEARAKRMVAWLQDCGMMEASPETLWAVYDMAPFVAMLAASTARPTERGAVPEGWALVPINLTAEMAKAGAKGRQNSAVSSFRDGWKYALAAVPALTPPVTVAATDQAGEVGDEGSIADAARRIASWSGNKVGIYKAAKRELAALDTQPATGATNEPT